MILPIIKFPNKLLQSKTEAVKFPLSLEMKKLTRDMAETVRKADGVGLAAPQVGKLVKLLVINLEKSGVPLFPLYNAKVVKRGWKKMDIEEGCLSIPGVFGMVRRPLKVVIEAQNMNGKKIQITDEGWVSRVAQHEIDHTNGILIFKYIKKYTQGEDRVKEWEEKKLI